jgi:leucine dehydrogenase
VGFTAWIAVHNSNRGPSLGGCRIWNYTSDEASLTDVLRLSKGMTYKNALARLPLGGGKSVVRADLARVDRRVLFEQVGEFVDRLGGRYITAEDVNSTVEDMTVVKERTGHVATVGASGNPSPFTAYGVYCAIRASVRHLLKREQLDGLTVAIQGVGETGGRLAELLKADHCRIVAADINSENTRKLSEKIDFEEVAPEDIYDVGCDVFSPCALGGTLNSGTIPRLLCQIVAGSANNQLLADADGIHLFNRGILYAPDYAANAGGVINISCEIGRRYDAGRARMLTAGIGDTLMEIYRLSKERHLPTHLVADSLAEELFDAAGAMAC